jgi:hypothetical protein
MLMPRFDSLAAMGQVMALYYHDGKRWRTRDLGKLCE